MLIWSATESCVTIMCSSIPVLRPLYVRIKYGKDGKSSSSSGNTSYRMPMYGSNRKWGKFSKSDLESSVGPGEISYQTTVMKHGRRNSSDENILDSAAGIERTDEISVSYEQYGRKI